MVYRHGEWPLLSCDIPCRTEPGPNPLNCTRKIVAPNGHPLATLFPAFEILDEEFQGDVKCKGEPESRARQETQLCIVTSRETIEHHYHLEQKPRGPALEQSKFIGPKCHDRSIVRSKGAGIAYGWMDGGEAGTRTRTTYDDRRAHGRQRVEVTRMDERASANEGRKDITQRMHEYANQHHHPSSLPLLDRSIPRIGSAQDAAGFTSAAANTDLSSRAIRNASEERMVSGGGGKKERPGSASAAFLLLLYTPSAITPTFQVGARRESGREEFVLVFVVSSGFVSQLRQIEFNSAPNEVSRTFAPRPTHRDVIYHPLAPVSMVHAVRPDQEHQEERWNSHFMVKYDNERCAPEREKIKGTTSHRKLATAWERNLYDIPTPKAVSHVPWYKERPTVYHVQA
ncbi:hypothetical protein DFP72DRAFT_857936 [Ephemerocybe angulata]|uniref:Uncharacterized protein n=1 Tax=Ephemerocybe angulata TaxID=980116 RepID=A0A8H6HD57_9AGAR|nr:hypothetical protein DFP72DRAFT_857936 [Tulosesus angulatus]